MALGRTPFETQGHHAMDHPEEVGLGRFVQSGATRRESWEGWDHAMAWQFEHTAKSAAAKERVWSRGKRGGLPCAAEAERQSEARRDYESNEFYFLYEAKPASARLTSTATAIGMVSLLLIAQSAGQRPSLVAGSACRQEPGG
jgi:hypothetical protein